MTRNRLHSSIVLTFSLMAYLSSVQAAPLSSPVGVGMANIAGHKEKVLVASDGHTLYYFTGDKADTPTCTGTCAMIWPPLLAHGKRIPPVRGVPGSFTATQGANGLQVDYNGHPLYRYVHDKTPGEALGNGIFGGTWWAAVPNVKPISQPETAIGNSRKRSGW